jgi:hypothetical protein
VQGRPSILRAQRPLLKAYEKLAGVYEGAEHLVWERENVGTWEGFVTYIHPSDHLTSATISDMAGAYATRLGAWELENGFSERGNMKVGHPLAGA